MFSTGQVVEGAVAYTAANAVCGEPTTGDVLLDSTNITNMTLPALQACASPIGPKWIAAVTNWLCFLIDRGLTAHGGASFSAASICQSPLLVINAVRAVVDYAHTDMLGAFWPRTGAFMTPANILNNLASIARPLSGTPNETDLVLIINGGKLCSCTAAQFLGLVTSVSLTPPTPPTQGVAAFIPVSPGAPDYT